MSDVFRKVTELAGEIRIRPAEAELLKLFRTSSGTYTDFAELLADDPELEGNILQVANKAIEGKVTEPILSTASALSFLGFMPTRNFIAASIISGHSSGQALALAPGSAETNDVVKLALLGESRVQETDSARADFFVAGLIFDSLRMLAARTQTLAPRELIEKRLGELWAHAYAVTSVARQLAKNLAPALSVDKDLVLDGMLHDIGSGLFALLASEKEAPFETPELSRAVEREAARWGFGHPVYGNLLLSRFRVFKDTSWVALFHHEPFLAPKTGSHLRERATLIWLADRMIAYRDLNGNAKFPTQNLHRWKSAIRAVIQPVDAEFEKAIENCMRAAP